MNFRQFSKVQCIEHTRLAKTFEGIHEFLQSEDTGCRETDEKGEEHAFMHGRLALCSLVMTSADRNVTSGEINKVSRPRCALLIQRERVLFNEASW